MSKEPFLESAVMEILWEAGGPLTPAEVRTQLLLSRKVVYTTVLTVVSRLWKKGLLERKPQGRSYVYAPAENKEQSVARRMEELLQATDQRGLTLARFLTRLSSDDRKALEELVRGHE